MSAPASTDAASVGATAAAAIRGPVMVLAGSLRADSMSRRFAETATAMFTAAGTEAWLVSIEELNLPAYNPDIHTAAAPGPAAEFVRMTRAARAFVWCSPAYHRTLSGSFKNALDYLEILAKDDPPYLSSKAVGLIGVSSGPKSAMTTIMSLEMVAQGLYAFVLPYIIPIAQSARLYDEAGALADDRARKGLSSLVRETQSFLRNYRYPPI